MEVSVVGMGSVSLEEEKKKQRFILMCEKMVEGQST